MHGLKQMKEYGCMHKIFLDGFYRISLKAILLIFTKTKL